MLSGGHLFLADASAIETAPARRILLYRDPYDWVIALARFFVSEQFVSNMDHLNSDALTADELLTLLIFVFPFYSPSLLFISYIISAPLLVSRFLVVSSYFLFLHFVSPLPSSSLSFVF